MTKSDSQAAIKSPFITLPEAVEATHCPRSTILKYSRLGLFPQVIRLLGDRIAFNRADVQSWIDCRVASAMEAENDEK
jgi:predicted DNA-binding transcriptional regulator AlpA